MLDERARKVLFAVIQSHISSPGPVGSRHISKKYSFGLSPASIRNIMSDLEDMGFLSQPHTSAGRVPTDFGYRCYVNYYGQEQADHDELLLLEVKKKLESLKKDINTVLNEAAKVLSSISHYVGITTSPGASSTILNRIELIRYRGNSTAVILFSDEGLIRSRIIEMGDDLSSRSLGSISDYINSTYAGLTIEEIRRRVIDEMARETIVCDNMISRAVRICRDIFSTPPESVFISGVSAMLDHPDFCDTARIRELLRAIEDKQLIVGLLDRLADQRGTQVLIGSENPMNEMKRFSVVVSNYREGGRPIGSIGLIGPTRMNYREAISLVELTAGYITEMLSQR